MSKAAYKHPLLGFFHDLRDAQLPAVVFGGTLRDLVVKGSSEQPRDVDVVVDTPSLIAIESLFRVYIKKRTRFGGLHLNVGLWPIDIWPLPCTWALRDRLSRNSIGLGLAGSRISLAVCFKPNPELVAFPPTED